MTRRKWFSFIVSTALLVVSAACIAPAFAGGQQPKEERSKPFTAERHIGLGLTCKDCHGEGKKRAVKGDKCLECHQSYEVVAKSTQDIKPNPHANHITTNDLDCTSCHKGHDADVVYCTNCHKGLSFKRTPATSKN